jgi:undecaprenyl-diphosphatase
VFTAVSALGSSAVLVPVLAAAAVWFRWARGTWRPAALLGAGYGGAVALYGLIKALVARPRPPLGMAVGHFRGYAFPSGHATQAIVAWGMLAALVAGLTPSWSRKVAAWASALLVAVLVAATRVYLGAHWFTDVVGGLVLGALWLSAILTLSRSVPVLRGNPGPVRPGTRRSPSP